MDEKDLSVSLISLKNLLDSPMFTFEVGYHHI